MLPAPCERYPVGLTHDDKAQDVSAIERQTQTALAPDHERLERNVARTIVVVAVIGFLGLVLALWNAACGLSVFGLAILLLAGIGLSRAPRV